MYDGTVALYQKKYINILFISDFSLSFTVSHLSLSFSVSHSLSSLSPSSLSSLYSPSYHYHSPDSRFTLQSTELHHDHQPNLKPISKLQIGEIHMVTQLSWRLAWWVSRLARSTVVGIWVRCCGYCRQDQRWWLISWWVSLLLARLALWVFPPSWWFL